jgi:glycosyltransferase involved in cell wall biosynthesis
VGQLDLSLSVKPSECDAHLAVSIIVCTLGNRPSLWNCLRSLQSQGCRHSETLVVLNGQPNEELARFLESYAFRVINEPRHGVCIARNRAIPQARGEILAFVDDDVIASPGWLHELLKGFANPAVACVTGLVVPGGSVPHSEERTNRYYASLRAQSTWVLSSTEDDWLQKAVGEPAGFGCNMAFRKNFLEEHGPFPEDLGAGSQIGGGDEVYMFLQVLKHRLLIYHSPSAVVTHVFASDIVQKKRMMQAYSGTVAFAIKLFVEEKNLRRKITAWLFAGLLRRLLRIISRRSIASEPQELLTTSEKFFAYLRGPLVYWRSSRAARLNDR